MDRDLYTRLGEALRKIATREDIIFTMIIGNGRFFSAGADIKAADRDPPNDVSPRRFYLSTFAVGNIDVARAFYEHPKILIAALNGPVIGLTAALVACCDFVYAVDSAYLLTPFTDLGLVPEGASSYMFVQRMGIAKANEALLQSKKISAQELLARGFVNRLFPQQPDSSFRTSVLTYIKDRFDGINRESLIKSKHIIRSHYSQAIEAANLREAFQGLDRFVAGIPQKEFKKLATHEKRHRAVGPNSNSKL